MTDIDVGVRPVRRPADRVTGDCFELAKRPVPDPSGSTEASTLRTSTSPGPGGAFIGIPAGDDVGERPVRVRADPAA